jgi:hypothetical protein
MIRELADPLILLRRGGFFGPSSHRYLGIAEGSESQVVCHHNMTKLDELSQIKGSALVSMAVYFGKPRPGLRSEACQAVRQTV